MTAVAAPKRRSTRRILLAALITVGLGWLATLLVRRELHARRLAAVIAELDRTDPGWRLDDLERARPNIPHAENSAVVIDAAFAKLIRPRQAPVNTFDYLGERGVPPNVRLSPGEERELRDALKLNAPVVPDILALADRPRGRHAIAYTPGVFMTPLPHIDRMTQVNSRVLTPLGCLAVHDGDVPRALTAIRARLNLGRSLRDEPLATSQVGLAGDFRRRAIRDLERLLGHATLSPDQLVEVRHELAAELAYDPWPVGFRGERAVADRVMTALRDGTIKTSSVKSIALGSYSPTPSERVGEWVNDHVIVETAAAHAAALDLWTRAVETAALPWPARLRVVKALDAEWAAAADLVRWVGVVKTAWWADGLVADRARLNCAVAAVAVEQYRVAHGHWPESLAALGGPLPDDPYTGKPLCFKPLAEGVVVYSVGRNQRGDPGDNGGNVSDYGVTGRPDYGVIGVRLWDVAHRNRLPRSLP